MNNPDKPEADYLEFAKNWYEVTKIAPVHCDGRLLHHIEKCWACALPQYKPLHDFRAKYDINYSGETGRRYPCPVENIRSVEQAHRWHGNHPHTAEERDEASKKFRKELLELSKSYGITVNDG